MLQYRRQNERSLTHMYTEKNHYWRQHIEKKQELQLTRLLPRLTAWGRGWKVIRLLGSIGRNIASVLITERQLHWGTSVGAYVPKTPSLISAVS